MAIPKPGKKTTSSVKNPSIAKVLNTTATPQKSTALKTTTTAPAQPSFFSKDGQKQAVGRLTNVLNPFANEPIRLAGTNIDVGGYVRSVVRIGEGALAFPAVASLLSRVGGKTAASAAIPRVAGSSKFMSLLTAGGIGAAAGFLLSTPKGQTAAPQTQTPTQNSTQYTEANQYTYAPVDARTYQKTTNYIRDSPGASVSSSQAAEPRVVVAPGQDVTPSLAPYQGLEQGQTQTGETPWIWIAAIGAVAFILGGRK